MSIDIENLLSRESIEKIGIYEGLIREWNRRTGLVQVDTLEDFYNRHVLDSLQIIPLIRQLSQNAVPAVESFRSLIADSNKLDELEPSVQIPSIIDIGTGAGFPGLVLAIIGFSNITLCESNMKKCIFLEEVARQTNTKVTILNSRIEHVASKYDIIISRACSDLRQLLAYTKHLSRDVLTTGLFHKGRHWQDEVISAMESWAFDVTPYPSLTSKEGVLLLVRNIKPR